MRSKLVVKFTPMKQKGKILHNIQNKVKQWSIDCFGETISNDKIERNHRFLEESLQSVQSLGCTKDECHKLVDYVFSRSMDETEHWKNDARIIGNIRAHDIIRASNYFLDNN